MEGTGGEGSKSKDLKESPAAAAAPETKKGPWTAEEDAILIEHVRRNGEGNWNSVQRTSGLLRCGKSCRLRWANHLRPNLKKGQLTPEEELLVLRLHAQLGNKWARMAAQLPGRTDNEIKNYWNTRVKRRQRAGLPLYPPGILQRHRPPPLLIPSGGAAAAAVPPLSSSPPVFSSPMMMPSAMAFSPSSSALRQLAEAPRAAKRARDDDGTTTMFRFPVSPLPSVVPRMWHTAPSTPTGTTMLDYSIVPPMTPPMAPSAYSAGTEMLARSSSCHVLDGSGGVELMDKLLQEAERAEQKEERDRAFDWADPFGSFDEGKESVVGGAAAAAEAFMGLEELHSSSNGEPAPPTNYSESNQLPTTNASAATNTTGISVSGLLEMIPTQPAAPAAAATTDWNNNSEGSDVSNGGQSAVTNDDLAVDLHQLASSLPDAQMEPDWTMSSCHWNNLPELM